MPALRAIEIDLFDALGQAVHSSDYIYILFHSEPAADRLNVGERKLLYNCCILFVRALDSNCLIGSLPLVHPVSLGCWTHWRGSSVRSPERFAASVWVWPLAGRTMGTTFRPLCKICRPFLPDLPRTRCSVSGCTTTCFTGTANKTSLGGAIGFVCKHTSILVVL